MGQPATLVRQAGGESPVRAALRGMTRLPRNEQPDFIYNVLARGVNRVRTFVDEEDYRTYVALLVAVVERCGWRLLAFCLMPNHVHLVIQAPDLNLGYGMQLLHGKYARHFNDRHGRVGHLFQDRFKSPVVQTDEALVRLVGYVVANPVKARLVKRAVDWPWGSHPAVAEGRRAPSWLAHDELKDHLEAGTGIRCYDTLIETWEAAARANAY